MTTEGEMTDRVIAAVEELTRRLVHDLVRPPGASDEAPDERRRALARLAVLVQVEQAVHDLEQGAAHAAAVAGAGYPEIGRAARMTRQGARRRWPGLTRAVSRHPSPAPLRST
ncbi:hypothetical protein [Streptomyces sp. B93]|uniref:hypothetical protein n=1 Tax=Streptomyces sp. B93 TaxID=2824875 RepID=UPI001B370D42|nr:hypothetical protein [Streptomyces sp. B93]MBQ1093608.1 hypothetical protein [Streptomyces sp. B93]